MYDYIPSLNACIGPDSEEHIPSATANSGNKTQSVKSIDAFGFLNSAVSTTIRQGWLATPVGYLILLSQRASSTFSALAQALALAALALPVAASPSRTPSRPHGSLTMQLCAGQECQTELSKLVPLKTSNIIDCIRCQILWSPPIRAQIFMRNNTI